jgi:hypothetical protein
MSGPLDEFERILNDMNQGFGRKRSATGLRAPADFGRRREDASAMRSCVGVVAIALILGFIFSMTWLILTHV